MSQATRIAALNAAVSVPAVRDAGLTETLMCAAALNRWLLGHPSAVSRGKRRSCNLLARLRRSFLSIKHGYRILDQGADVLARIRSDVKNIARRFALRSSNRRNDLPDQGLSGGGKFTYDGSSSVLADGESPAEVTTPLGHDIIIENRGDKLVIRTISRGH